MSIVHDYRFGLIIPAAGQGTRMGGDIPKIFISLNDSTVLRVTASVFAELGWIDRAVIAVRPEHMDRAREEIRDIELAVDIIAGGERRQDSVQEAFAQLNDVDYIMVHDAVRPLITAAVIHRVAEAAIEYGAAIPGVMPRATIKTCDHDGFISHTPDRTDLFEAQTPQIFRRDLYGAGLMLCSEQGKEVTDDASMIELTGNPVKAVEGDYRNMKLTMPEDITAARILLEG